MCKDLINDIYVNNVTVAIRTQPVRREAVKTGAKVGVGAAI